MFDVIGLGENSVDLVYRLPQWPAGESSGSKVPIAGSDVRCGGQVATALAACASLGLKTQYLGTFGNDEHGARIRAALKRRGIDVRSSPTRRAPNRYAVILIDERSGGRTVLWHRDSRLSLQPGDLRAFRWRARWLHVDGIDEDASLDAAERAASLRMPVSCDVDDVTPGTRELIRRVEVPILAEHLPQALTGERDLEAALRRLRRPHHVALCVTRGARGSMMLCGDRMYRATAFKVKAVDTTGAGDVFRGAFIAGMLRGFEPRQVLRFANAAAAVSVTRPGAIDSVPSNQEVERLLRLPSRV